MYQSAFRPYQTRVVATGCHLNRDEDSPVLEPRAYGEVASAVFFFFQAEDGIRDLTVTGVQTCALPIWLAIAGATNSSFVFTGSAGTNAVYVVVQNGGVPATNGPQTIVISPVAPVVRSEEHTSELQSQSNLVCRLLLEKKKQDSTPTPHD